MHLLRHCRRRQATVALRSRVPVGLPERRYCWGVVIALVVVVGVLVALVATGTVHWFDGGASSPNTTSSGTATKQSGNQGSASKSKDKAKPAKTCDAAPDMTVSSIKSESDNLIVTILATSNCDDKNASTKFNDSATRLTLQDSDDNVVADAVFDFSGLFHVYRTAVQQA